jgi:hypothetical protein
MVLGTREGTQAGGILSTIKPKIAQKPEVKIEWNDRSYQSFMNAGFPNNIPHTITGPRERMLRFLSAVDLTKGPLERTVKSMVRLRAQDWSTKKRELREFIYYEEEFNAKNWAGVPLNPVSDHIEGRYTEVLTRPVFDERTGVHTDNAWGGTRMVYYIPFSKQKVDEIIKNSAHSDKDSIRFIIKFGMEDSPDSFQLTTRNQFSYDRFVNWSWDRLKEFQYWPVDDLFNRPKTGAATSTTTTKLEFKPQ